MRYILTLVLTFGLMTDALASSIEDFWLQGLQMVSAGKYTEAEHFFDNAVLLMEKDNDYRKNYILVDRAKLNLILNKPKEALADLDIAISSEALSLEDKLRAYRTRINTYFTLELEQEAIDDFEKYNSLNPLKPTTQIMEDKIIMRNMPIEECYKDSLKEFFINLGICDHEDDIQYLPSQVCVIKRCHPYEGCYMGNASESSCKGWCTKCAKAADLLCSAFKKFQCRAACVVAIEALKEKCDQCCAGGQFYKDCIEPYAHITDFMSIPCDPAWD